MQNSTKCTAAVCRTVNCVLQLCAEQYTVYYSDEHEQQMAATTVRVCCLFSRYCNPDLSLRRYIAYVFNKNLIPKCHSSVIMITVEMSNFPTDCSTDVPLVQRFSNFFQVGTTFISQNVLRTTLLLGLSNSLVLP